MIGSGIGKSFGLMQRRYALETMTAFALLFIAFGVGLDPRQKGVFGPALSPILVCTHSVAMYHRLTYSLGRFCARTVQFCVWCCSSWIHWGV